MSSELTVPNSTDTDQYKPWFYDAGWNWFVWNIFVWLFPLVCLIGAIANACSFCVIALNRKSFPYVTRQYLLIITMTDFLVLTCKASTHYFGYLTFFVKENAWTWYTVPRDWSFIWCIVYDFITYYSNVGAPFFQLGLTVDRLVAVAAPLKARTILTHRRSWILLAVIAVMALLLPVLFVSNRKWNSNTGTCGLQVTSLYFTVYLPAELYFGRVFLVSALVLGTASICVLLAWSNRSAQRMQAGTGTASQQQQQSSRERRRSLVRVSLMLVFINAIFLGTSLPWSIGATLQSVNLQISTNSKAYIIMMRHFNSLIYMNTVLSWPAYFMGRNFRMAFSRIFVPPCLRKCLLQNAAQQSYRYESSRAAATDSRIDLSMTVRS